MSSLKSYFKEETDKSNFNSGNFVIKLNIWMIFKSGLFDFCDLVRIDYSYYGLQNCVIRQKMAQRTSFTEFIWSKFLHM